MAENSNKQGVSRDDQFLRLLMGNQEKFYAYILSLVHNSSDAEDIMQDATTVMWRKFDTFKPGTNFTAWGITIARMLVLKFFEKNRHSKLSFSPDLEEKIAAVTEKSLTTETADFVRTLKECLNKLETRSYNLIKMRYFDKKPTKEIASERGVPLHTMYRMMGKIHELLRHCVRRSILAKEGA